MSYSVRSRTKTSAKLKKSNRHVVTIRKSHQHMNALVISPENKLITSVSTEVLKRKGKINYGGNVLASQALAKELAAFFKERKITKVSFNRSGWVYHGRIKAFVEVLREERIEV